MLVKDIYPLRKERFLDFNFDALEGFLMDRKIPKTMSTQHPDNATLPKWVNGDVIQGDAEVDEAYFAYSSLGCMEVMWDSEGKDVDTRVVRKLLDKYRDFFKEKVLGEDVFLTYRIPNPTIERVERKILLESLVNIPVAHDIAAAFYKREVSPIFEVILPLTTCGKDIIGLRKYYEKAIVGVEEIFICGSEKVEDWIGSFKPKTIEVIPLIEDIASLLKADEILKPYISDVKPEYMRVFLARSDPALNYGLVCAVVLCKIALSKLRILENLTSVKIYPIIGVGTMPFRGHLNPSNLTNFLEEYNGVYTATIQSSFKYDYPFENVKEAIKTLNENLPYKDPQTIEPSEEEVLRQVLAKFMERYQKTIESLAPLINSVARYVPQRRARKLHIGLFGYSRSVGKVSLPRAIPFACALYTLGIPPEFIGLGALNELNEAEWNILKAYYKNFEHDLELVAGFLSWRNLNMLADMYPQVAKMVNAEEDKLRTAISNILMDLNVVEENFGLKLGPRSLSQRKYENVINDFLIAFLEENPMDVENRLLEAAKMRKCLG